MDNQVIPFHIPAGAAVVKRTIRNDGRVKLSLHAVTGGPVFMFREAIDAATAAQKSTGGNDDSADFELAASATGEACAVFDNGIGQVTLFSTVETVGYLKVEGCARTPSAVDHAIPSAS